MGMRCELCSTGLPRAAVATWPAIVPHDLSLYWQLALIPGMRFDYSHANFSLLSPGCHPHSPSRVSGDDRCLRSGGDPCYIVVDKAGKHVLVANYTGGSVAVFPIEEGGKLGEASAFVQHTGHGADPKRQEGPHGHSIDLSPDNKFAFVDDLGLDH